MSIVANPREAARSCRGPMIPPKTGSSVVAVAVAVVKQIIFLLTVQKVWLAGSTAYVAAASFVSRVAFFLLKFSSFSLILP